MNFNFGEVLSRAGQITWKHKNLWLAGIVITLVSLVPMLVSLPFSSSVFSFSDPAELNRQMPLFLLANGLTVLISILLIPVYAIGMAIPSLGTVRLEKGSQALNLGELIKGTLPYFWRILGVVVLVWLGALIAMVALMACDAVVSMVTFGIGILCLFPLFIPLAILILALMEEGMAAVLMDDLGVSNALQRAWELIKKNVGVMALLSVIIYLVSAIVGMIISVPMMIPMFGFMTNIMQSAGAEPDPRLFEGMFRNMIWWMLAFSPLYAVFQGVFLTFMQSVWTLTYMRLTQPQLNVPVTLEANA
jgi:hypothetical protein